MIPEKNISKKGFIPTPKISVCKCGDEWQKRAECKPKSHGCKPSVRGFTLIELMVSIFVVGVIVASIAANTGTGKKNSDVKNSANTFVASLRKAQALALAGTTIPNCNMGSQGAVGVFFDTYGSVGYPSTHFIFADLKDMTSGLRDGLCPSCYNPTSCGGGVGTEWFEEVPLGGGVRISGICSVDLSPGPSNPCPAVSSMQMTIVFTAPDPEIKICDVTGDCSYRSVTVSFQSPDTTVQPVNVTVDTRGRIQY